MKKKVAKGPAHLERAGAVDIFLGLRGESDKLNHAQRLLRAVWVVHDGRTLKHERNACEELADYKIPKILCMIIERTMYLGNNIPTTHVQSTIYSLIVRYIRHINRLRGNTN